MEPREPFRLTRQRRVILEELRKLSGHPTADEIYRAVRQRMPRISLGTVYRNLEVLSARGMVKKLELGLAQRRYDGRLEDHCHVRCVRCGRVEDAPGDPLVGAVAAVNQVSDFEVIGHRLEFIGVCPECKRSGARDAVAGNDSGEDAQDALEPESRLMEGGAG